MLTLEHIARQLDAQHVELQLLRRLLAEVLAGQIQPARPLARSDAQDEARRLLLWPPIAEAMGTAVFSVADLFRRATSPECPALTRALEPFAHGGAGDDANHSPHKRLGRFLAASKGRAAVGLTMEHVGEDRGAQLYVMRSDAARAV